MSEKCVAFLNNLKDQLGKEFPNIKVEVKPAPKGVATYDELYLYGDGRGVEGGVGAGASESRGNLSDERKYDLYSRLIDIFNDINQDGDYDSMGQIITDALDSSDFASNFIARLGKRIASSF